MRRICNDEFSDGEFALLAQVNGLRSIYVAPTNQRVFATTKIGDGALRTISQLPEIETIFISGMNFTPDGIALLAKARTLNFAHIFGCSPSVDLIAVEPLVAL